MLSERLRTNVRRRLCCYNPHPLRLLLPSDGAQKSTFGMCLHQSPIFRYRGGGELLVRYTASPAAVAACWQCTHDFKVCTNHLPM